METKPSFNFDKRVILGALFIFLGCLFLIDNIGWLNFSISNVFFSLPMVAIIIGALNLNRGRNNAFGYILIAGGVLFLLPRIFNMGYSTNHLFLPFILVSLGVMILFHNKHQHHHNDKANANWSDYTSKKEWHNHDKWYKREESSSELIDELNVFGGCERRMTTKNFKGGKVTSIFGGATYDFRDCELADGRNVLDIVNLFGGTKLIFPSHWKVHVEVVSIFGGFADKRLNVSVDDNTQKELHIVGIVIFGGGEIKSF